MACPERGTVHRTDVARDKSGQKRNTTACAAVGTKMVKETVEDGRELVGVNAVTSQRDAEGRVLSCHNPVRSWHVCHTRDRDPTDQIGGVLKIVQPTWESVPRHGIQYVAPA